MALDYKEMTEALRAGIRNPPKVTEYVGLRDMAYRQSLFGFDLAKPGSDRTVVAVVPSCPVPVAPKQPDPDHIWNMIVLAAQSSRYE